ncbi:MAG: NUDIX domain-containing protein [Candidatus Paceibacterota bacterium]
MNKVPKNSELRFAVLSTDTTLFTVRDKQLFVRLVAIHRPPYYQNAWGLPGGLVHPSETAEIAALRHLKEKSHIDPRKIYVEQLFTFSKVDRDPRGRVVAVAYLALVPWEALSTPEQEDTDDSKWVPVTRATKLAYDHDEILSVGTKRLRSRLTYTTLISKLMPEEFTLTELEVAYECILKAGLDKRNFRKKILKLDVLKESPYKRSGDKHRPAQFYSFVSKKVHEIEVI